MPDGNIHRVKSNCVTHLSYAIKKFKDLEALNKADTDEIMDTNTLREDL